MTQNDPDDTDQEPGRLRQMYEEAAKRDAASSARVAELERREAFRDAGLDLTNPLHVVVAESYKGELTSEKVKEHVDSLGLKARTADTPPPEIPERAAMERMASASAGDGGPATEPDRVAALTAQMADAARRNNMQELDRISVELARATGNQIRSQ